MVSIRYSIIAASVIVQAACDSSSLVSPRSNDTRAVLSPTHTLEGPSVIRRPADSNHVETGRVVLRGTRMATGCDYSYEHTLRPARGAKVKVTVWIAEYDPTTCDFVIATGRHIRRTIVGITSEASRPDTAYAAQGQPATGAMVLSIRRPGSGS
jgi:hypothetical protein